MLNYANIMEIKLNTMMYNFTRLQLAQIKVCWHQVLAGYGAPGTALPHHWWRCGCHGNLVTPVDEAHHCDQKLCLHVVAMHAHVTPTRTCDTYTHV